MDYSPSQPTTAATDELFQQLAKQLEDERAYQAALSGILGIISRSDMFVAVDNTVVVPAYTRADAAVFYSFSERWRLQANVENLFNRAYFINADSNTNISPGSPRALRVGLTARF